VSDNLKLAEQALSHLDDKVERIRQVKPALSTFYIGKKTQFNNSCSCGIFIKALLSQFLMLL